MNAIVRRILDRASHWPEEDQEELAQAALEIELRRLAPYAATPDELKAIDTALDEARRGETVSEALVEQLLAKHRKA